MLTKAIPLEVLDLKETAGERTFTAYASTFGNTDEGGDIVAKGAFKKTLTARDFRPLLWQHDQRQPIGVEKSLKEDGRGLIGTWRLLKTGPAEYAYEALREKAVRAMSIGYMPTVVELNAENDGVRVLKEVDLLENSVVSLPMNEEALVQNVKDLFGDVLGLDYDRLAAALVRAGIDAKAEWDTAYVNNLPDSAFAAIEPGGKKDDEGKTVPRSLRHYPHHSAGGALDLPHLRNALARIADPNNYQGGKGHLQAHAKAEGVGGKADDDHNHDDASLDGLIETLTFSELVTVLAHIHNTFSESARNLLATLTDNAAALTESKRQELEQLLGTFPGLDAVRTDVQRLLATASPTREDKGDASGTSSFALSLELRRRRLRAAGVEV